MRKTIILMVLALTTACRTINKTTTTSQTTAETNTTSQTAATSSAATTQSSAITRTITEEVTGPVQVAGATNNISATLQQLTTGDTITSAVGDIHLKLYQDAATGKIVSQAKTAARQVMAPFKRTVIENINSAATGHTVAIASATTNQHSKTKQNQAFTQVNKTATGHCGWRCWLLIIALSGLAFYCFYRGLKKD